MKILSNIARILVGAVFLFSGFVKGVDPLGTAYKIEDYFIAYGTEWAIPAALALSIILCTVEFVTGASLFFNLRMKVMAWPLMLIMVYFTVLTFFDAIYNPVPDCGCFGDAIKLTNWETFYKNVALMVPVLLIFYYRQKFHSILSKRWEFVSIGLIALLFLGFSWYQYQHLPWLDFRDWKVGTDLVPDERGEEKVFLRYRNTETGEEKEYLSPDYPWNDSAWVAQWEFVDQRVDDSGVIKGHKLAIYDKEGNDVTGQFIENPSYQFLLVAYDLEKSDAHGMAKASAIYRDAENAGYSFIAVTGTLMDYVDGHLESKGIDPGMEIYNADDTELKTMIRSNPGLILLHNGVVIGKWHFNDFPSYDVIESEFMVNNDE